MKIRSFFLDKIKLFKSPNSNVPIIQKNSFLKFKELYIFLLDRYKEVAIEIRLKYIYTIRSYYQYMFEKYTRHIIKLQVIFCFYFYFYFYFSFIIINSMLLIAILIIIIIIIIFNK